MALYHLSARNVSRKHGGSAKAKAQYIQRESSYVGQEDPLIHKESGNMPEWAKDNPTGFWSAADDFERANGRLAREIEVALPNELTREQQIELARGFTQDLTEKENLPYTFGVHEGRGNNPHAHILLSERGNDGIARDREHYFKRANKDHPERGGAPKTTNLRDKAWLERTREGWAQKTNEALSKAGKESRIDHRSLQAQGSRRIPQQHLGPKALAMEERGVRTEKGDNHMAIREANERIWQEEREMNHSHEKDTGLELG